MLRSRRQARAAAANLVAARQPAKRDPVLTRATDAMVRLVGKVMGKRSSARSYAEQLDHAGLRLRPQEYVVLLIIAAVVLALAGATAVGLPGLLLAVASPIGGKVLLRWLKGRRQQRFAEQLVTTLTLISGSMRAASSFTQAMASTAQDTEGPMADELGRVVNAVRMGRDVGEALHEVAERMESIDLRWVAEAVDIHSDVGGDLADVLDSVVETIRERDAIKAEIRALSAEGKVSQYVLLALPFVTTGALMLINPSYLTPLFSSVLGYVCLAVPLVMMAIGSLWLRSINTVKF